MDVFYTILSFGDNILVQALLAFPLLLSMIVTYRCLQVPDVTIDGSTIVGAAVCVMLVRGTGLPLPAALVLGTTAGFVAGLLTGLLIEVLKINALLAGILNAFILYSVGLMLVGASLDFADGTTLFSWLKEHDRVAGNGLPSGLIVHPYVLLFLGAICTVLKLGVDWFLRREWGVALRGAGGNDFFLQLRGINTRRLRVFGFGLANALASFGAILLSMYEGSVQVMRWPGTIIFALSVAIIGWELARQMNLRLGMSVGDTTAILMGALVYFTIVRACYTFNVPTALPRLLIAAYIILVLASHRGMWRRARELIH